MYEALDVTSGSVRSHLTSL